MRPQKRERVIVIGASVAGLSSARCLQDLGVRALIVEREQEIASPWRKHYRRLHLHTSKQHSSLPGLEFSKDTPRYPSREQVVQYLDQYAKQLTRPPRFGATVERVVQTTEGWTVTLAGETEPLWADHVVIATGNTRLPKLPTHRGLDSFPGTTLHSAAYCDGSSFAGQDVLVVGFGNSACEIAICLTEHGARPTLSVRSAVNVVPRDIFGIPVLGLGAATAAFPDRVADRLTAPLLRWIVGDIEKLGLRKLPYGPKVQINQHGRIPLLNIGTIELIRDGRIKVRGAIDRFDGRTVRFVDGAIDVFDAVVFATGYRPGLDALVELTEQQLADLRIPLRDRTSIPDGLFLTGFFVSPRGMFREIADEARIIAQRVAHAG